MKKSKFMVIALVITLMILGTVFPAYAAESESDTDFIPNETISENMPMIDNIVPADGGIKISWTSYPGTAKYRLFLKRQDSNGWKTLADVAATSYVLTGLQNNTENTYTVRSVDADGKFMSDYSAEGYTYRYLAAPTLLNTESVNSGIKVTWQQVDGAENYRVYVKSSSGWKGIRFTERTSIIYKDVTSGSSYTFTVRCCSADGRTLTSYFDKHGISGRYIAPPEITSFEPVSGGIRVRWGAVPGAEKYRLFIRKPGYTGWFKVGDTYDTYFDHKGLTDGTDYTYTVRVLNGSSYASSYNSLGRSYTYFLPPTHWAVRWGGEGYLVQWQKASGALGCHLYRKSFGGEWKLLLHTRKRSVYYDTAVEPDTLYAYMLRYVDRDEKPTTVVSDSVSYYINGEPANGTYTVNGNQLRFHAGKLSQGYVTIDGKLYYYDQAGRLVKNNIAGTAKDGYTYADQNGVCCTSKEIKLAAEYMMKHCTGNTLDEKMKTGFLYMAKNFYYNRTYDHPSKASDLPALAIDMFTNERGNCYRYAACFACVAKIAGYRTRVVFGTTIGNPHGWVEVLVNGKWLICDPDAQIPAYGKPDYAAYMMEKHFWQITVKSRYELTINDNGVAVWK